MDKAKSIMKNGWHPEKPGSTFKQQVNSMIGRGSKEEDERLNRQVTPITQLRDPATFAPPPRRTQDSIRPPPSPPSGPRKIIPFQVGTDAYSQPKAREPLPPPKWTPDAAGQPQITQGGAPPPSLPPRLPPRRNTGSSTGSGTPISPPPPPARDNSGYSAPTGAMSRLANAGVTVPAFGIGQKTTDSQSNSNAMDKVTARFQRLTPSSSRGTSPAPPATGTTMEQKQAALKTAQNLQKDPSKVSLSDVKSAASTADNFRQRHGEQIATGAQKAQGFGDRVSALNQKYKISDKASGLTAKFGVGSSTTETTPSGKPAPAILPPPGSAPPAFGSNGPKQAGVGLGGQTSPPPLAPRPTQTMAPPPPPAPRINSVNVGTVGAVAVVKKKPPPPPPKKKITLPASAGQPAEEDTPPPIPLSTRPNF